MAVFPERDPQAVDLQIQNELRESRPPPQTNTFASVLFRVPWWALILLIIGTYVYISIEADELYSSIFNQLRDGLSVTLRVSFFAYAGALVIGLFIGVIRSTTPRPQPGFRRGLLSVLHLFLYNAATFFVEVVRGLPVLIVLLMAAFIGVPAIRDYLEAAFDIEIELRGSSVETAIIALALTYGAFLSEVFRAGIQSIEIGQIEASKSLGMNNFQTLRFIVLPQAIRRVIPPLGNDFIAMIKDSSLVAILGIRDVTQTAKVSSGSSFRYVETYLTVAVIYLTMTILGSIVVRLIERYLNNELNVPRMKSIFSQIFGRRTP
jgi:ABC-type amino acid transport system permease subunit